MYAHRGNRLPSALTEPPCCSLHCFAFILALFDDLASLVVLILFCCDLTGGEISAFHAQTLSGVLWNVAKAISAGYIRRERGDLLADCGFEVHQLQRRKTFAIYTFENCLGFDVWVYVLRI